MNHHQLEPTVRIGKAGITETIVKQVKDQLKKRKMIKVKFLPSAVEGNKKKLVADLAKQANAKVVHQVGFVAVLERIK